MALTATMRRFQVELSDVDRGVYESLELRAAQHPSESDRYLTARMLAIALEYQDELQFGRGVSSPDEATIWAKDLTGQVKVWIEVGLPAPDRLHKITKEADEVIVYAHKDPEMMVAALKSADVHRIDEIKVYRIDEELLRPLSARVGKNNQWDILRSEGRIYVTVDGDSYEGAVVQVHPG